MNVLQFLLCGLIGWASIPESPKAPLACNLSVTTNPSNITICNPGQTISLNAQISGGTPQLIQWTPTTGVANPNSANTTAVANGSGVYQVTVTALSTDNLITNGDFSAGATGFTSDYIPGTGGAFGLLSLEGQYAVASSPLATHTNFANCNDHSPGTGNMMVVNGAGVANQDVWCQTVSVTPNTNYGFSAWIASVVAASPAQLQFSVNGTIIGGTFNASASTCVWTEFFQIWNSGPTGVAQICIVNQNTALSGNDFAIDDIFFSEVCEASATVNVTLVEVDPTWFPVQDLCVGSPPFPLNSMLAQWATPGGTWTINGIPATIFNPAALGPGVHQVRYTVGTAPCVEMLTQSIVVLPIPNANWNPPSNLCTTSPSFNLNTLLSPTAQSGGTWRINGANATFFNPALLGPGTYSVSYTVGVFPCTNSQTHPIVVSPLPNAEWTPPLNLCSNSASFALNTLLSPLAQTGGTWTVNGATATVFNPATLGAGSHTVVYTVGVFPCSSSISQPIVVGLTPAAPQPLCQTISQDEVVFFWPLVPGATSYQVEVLTGQSGTLSVNTFTVNNLSPGETVTIRVRAIGSGNCAGPWSASVSCTSISCVQPMVEVSAVSPLCFYNMSPEITLVGTGTPSGGTGVWSGAGISNATAGTFDPLVAGPGIHTVRYTYTLNGCSGFDTTQILVQTPPILDMALDSIICVQDTATATFTGMASDTALYVWQFDGATVASGTGGGPYQLIWDIPGTRTVQVIVTDGACPPDTLIKTIQVDSLLAPPEIFCRTTVSTVEFYWNPQPEVTAYTVDVLSGETGIMPSDTSFLIENLLPGAAVEIALSAQSATTCPDTSAQRTCIAQDCPEVNISLQTPPPICLLPTTGLVQLTATVTGGPGMGIDNWQGTGITDTLAGIFHPGSALNGDNFITYTYTEGNCIYTAEATIRVNHRPTPFFETDNIICQSETATITYTGTASPNATFFWNLDGGTVVSGSGIGPLVVSWPTPGIKVVRLVVDEAGCVSVPFFQQIQVDPLVEIPQIQCIQTLNSVEFFWNDVPGASAYVINLIQGPIGMITSDTSYRMSNLLPEQEVVIQMTTVSSNSCPGNIQLSNCSAAPCPDVILDAPAVFTCFDAQPDTLQLAVSASGGAGNGVYSWSGEGIINSQQNLFLTHVGMTGRIVPVSILYQEGACAYRDTLLVQVNPVPTPDFVIGAPPCENAATTITYTGTASSQAVFSWDFGTDAVVNGTAVGPYQVSWPDEGTKTVSLQIEDSGCTSTLLEQTVSVTAPLVPPVISCEATYTEIIFTWQPTLGATSFEVNVLDGMPGTLVTDTSYVIQNLQPGDPVMLEVVVEDNGPCPPVATQLTCETDLCPAVSISIDPVLPICFDASIPDTIDLSFSLSGNSPQGTLLWSGPGIFDPSVARVALATGMIGQPNTILALYRESVCEYSASTDITVRAVPVAAFTADPLICNSDESTVAFTGSATGNAVFNWNFDGGQAIPGNGSGPQQVSWQDAGQYSVSLWISDNSCLSDTFSLDVQVDEPLLPPTLSCTPDFDNMTVSWTAVAGADNYDLQLPAGVTASALSDTSVSIQNLQPGTNLNYTLTALGTTICGSVSVTGSCATPLCPTRNLSWSTTPAICRGTAISIPIDLQGNGGNAWQITLSDGTNTTTLTILNDTLLQFSPTATTTYTITAATDPLLTICNIGLPAALTVVVNTPVEAGTSLAAPEFCAGENGLIVLADLLQNEQTGGVWTEISGQPSTGGAFNAATGTFNIAGQPSGTYRFRYALTAIAPCVSDFAEVSVVIHPNPVADAGTDQELDCLTSTASLGGPLTTITPGLNYQWQSNNGAMVAQPTQPLTETNEAGSFTLIVSNPVTGCQDQDVVLVSNNANSLGLNARAFDATCLNKFGSIVVDSVTGGDQPYLYSLNNGPFVAQQVFAALNPGDYHLVVQDATGCTSEMDFQIVAATTLEVELIAHLPEEPYTIDLGETADLTALVNIPEDQVQSVRWQPDTLGCAGCLEQTVQPFYSTAYTVTVTDVNGCTASDDILLYVRRERDVYIPNGFSPNGDGLNDVFMIFAGRQVSQIRSFLIFTRWGESIFQKNNFLPNDPAYGWDGIFRNQRMNSGVYVYFAEVEYIDGEVVIFKGDVVLME